MSPALRPIEAKNYSSPEPTRTFKARKNRTKDRLVQKKEVSKISSQKIEQLSKVSSSSILSRGQLLFFLNQAAFSVNLFLIASILIIYALTVYTQKLWSKEYQKLEMLQRHERELTATNETLKDKIARQAENLDTGLLPPNPERVIFLNSSSKNVTESGQNSNKPDIVYLKTNSSGY